MAVTTGLGATTSGGNLVVDLLNHITPVTAAVVATTVSIIGPLRLSLSTGLHTNAAPGTECGDTNYNRSQGSIGAWNAATTTAGAGYGVGFAQKTSNAGLTFFPTTGAALAQTLTGSALYSVDTTPCFVAYLNFAVSVTVPVNNTYTVASGSVTLQIS